MNPQRDCKEFKVETRTITEVQSEPITPPVVVVLCLQEFLLLFPSQKCI